MNTSANHSTSNAASDGAIAGLKVIDASRILAGPLCGQILADHGADVLKVEGPDGDETRRWGPPYMGASAAYFAGMNRNKRAIVLDLNQQSDRDHLSEMLATADVLIENFKLSTSRRWGLDSETLARRFPRLVHCRISGYGDDGPLGGRPAYDTAVQAETGLMSINGDEESGPFRVGLPIVDMTTGLNAVIGILLALQERQRSGSGQRVDIALFDSAVSLLHPHAVNYFASNQTPRRTGNSHPSVYPYDAFETERGSIYLAVGSDAQFQALCRVVGDPALAVDERFKTNSDRSIHREALYARLSVRFRLVDARQISDALIAAGVPCAVVASIDEVFANPHVEYRGMRVRIGDDYQGVGSPIRLSRTPATYRSAPPEFDDAASISMPR